jgi:hypothetical protein
VINDTWIINTNGGDPHWIEAGIFRGSLCTQGSGNVALNSWTCSSGYEANDNDRLMWIDDRSPCECYYGHVDTTDPASLNTPYDVYIYKLDSTDWIINIGQTFGGESTSNPLSPNMIRAGTEEIPQGVTSCSEQYNLQYWDSSGAYHDGWSNSANGDATLESHAPPYAWWVNEPYAVADRSNYPSCTTTYGANLAPGAPVLGANRTSAVPANTPAESGPKLDEAQVTQAALAFASDMGDTQPASVEHVESTREQAVATLSGDQVQGSQDVYAVVMRGRFDANSVAVPPGVQSPTGSVLTLVIDATTGEMTDFGIQNTIPNLATLGPVTSDQ